MAPFFRQIPAPWQSIARRPTARLFDCGGITAWLCAGLLVLGAGWLRAQEPSVDAQTAQSVATALDHLDSDQFQKREAAANQLDALVKKPKLGAYLAKEFARRLLAVNTSFEARTRLERYLKDLPRVANDEPAANANEIEPLLDRLSDDQSAARDTARRRLESMSAHVENIAPLLTQVKARLANPRLSLQTRRVLDEVLDKARESWVKAPPGQVTLPPVSQEQMERWLDEVAMSDPLQPAERVRREVAQLELEDLLVREDTRQSLMELVNARISAADEEDGAAVAAYQELADMVKPAMVAEVWGHQRQDVLNGQVEDWEHRQHLTVQHLLIDVPQMAEMATRPTHFDRIDDEQAHCVSGNSLTEGYYPVRVAIPHPSVGVDVMFYLINLPTPRERLLYEYRLRRPEAERLLEISERTLNRFVETGQVLDETHVMMLMQLDPGAVSRFAGRYFQKVPDQPMAASSGGLTGQATLHTVIAAVLVMVGTHEAVPALERLARSEATPKPDHDNPFDIAWIAALAIAQRDPWPEVDDWLASLIDEKQPLVLNAETVPELGGTAAGLLLERHQMSPYMFDLEPAGNDAFDRSSFAGFRFTSDKGHKAVRQWWEKEKKQGAKATAP